MSLAHNEVVDTLEQHGTELNWLKSKVAYLKDRSRRNNLKIRGISESILPNDLTRFLQQLLKSLNPNATEADLIIDRAHRIPKPKLILEASPRDFWCVFIFFGQGVSPLYNPKPCNAP